MSLWADIQADSFYFLHRYELVHVRYYRADRDRTDSVRLLLPDTQLLLAADDASAEEHWTQVQTALRAQLDRKLAAVDAPPEAPDQPQADDNSAKDKESRERTTRQALFHYR
ncbi:hypothetical protein Aduo_011573 [Ancylostoma duodenale]